MSTDPKKRRGFAFNLRVSCDHYGTVFTEVQTSPKSSPHVFDVNRQVVASCLNAGIGLTSLEALCESMGMACMSCATFNGHLTAIHKASKNSSTLNLSEAASKVKELYHPSSDDYFDITVSYDGTWQKRGHTSKHGVGAVTAAKSGLILDYEVSSSFCHQCEKMKHLDTASFNRWFVHHRLVCGKNHAGSSGAMEVEGAKKMWSRSEAMGFRYTTLVSDGDCKTFNELNSLKLKRPTIAIKKEECLNHVSKRLGTALQNLVSAQSKRGLTLGGRKSGSLTQVKIKLLQGYYKNANCKFSPAVIVFGHPIRYAFLFMNRLENSEILP